MNKTNNIISMAVFKGRVLEALENMKEEFKSNRTQHDMFFKRIRKLELKPSFSVSPIGWIMSLLGFRR